MLKVKQRTIKFPEKQDILDESSQKLFLRIDICSKLNIYTDISLWYVTDVTRHLTSSAETHPLSLKRSKICSLRSKSTVMVGKKMTQL